ncbi:MAG: hypothetical protein ACT4PO_15050 [Actinomycetota bacterium]
MVEIEVQRSDVEPHLSRFQVILRDPDYISRHDVTMSRADFERLSGGEGSPEDFVHRCFEFLLEREQKESILPSFDVTEIGRYFPEFEREIRPV